MAQKGLQERPQQGGRRWLDSSTLERVEWQHNSVANHHRQRVSTEPRPLSFNDCCCFLLYSGDVSKRDETGSTPLHVAATYGNINSIELLITRGANIFSLDNYGRTPARIAAYYKKADCCRYLDMLAIQWQSQNEDAVAKLQIKAMKDLKKRSKKIEEMKDSSRSSRASSYDYSTAPVGSPLKFDHHKERPVSSAEAGGRRKISQQDALRANFELRSSNSAPSVEKESGSGNNSASNSAGNTFSNLPRNRTGPLLNSLAQLPLKIEPPEDARHSVLDPLGSGNPRGGHRGSKGLPELELTGGHPTVTINESALATFLHSLDLVDCIQLLHKEKLDLDALSLCSEDDLISIGLSLGPRKKILNAIKKRKATIAGAGKLVDTEF